MSSRARHLVRQSEVPAFAIDEQNRIFAWNERAMRLLGFATDSVVGRDMAAVIQSRDAFGNAVCTRNCAFHAMAREHRPIEPYTLQMRNAAGHFVPIYGTIEVVRTPGTSDAYSLVFSIRPERRRQTLDALLERLLHRRLLADLANGSDALRLAEPQLTDRQRQVLALLAHGKTTSEIARALKVSVHTVRHHMQGILANLDCHSQAEAVAVAMRHQLI